MLERVRRLLSKAEGAATEAERDAYNAKAAELIARYGIEEALLDAQRAEPQQAADRVVDLDPPYARDKASLLSAVAGPLGVRAVLRSRRSAGGTALTMHLFGMGSDLERVDVLYTSLLVQAAHALAVIRPPSEFESVAAYRRSWMIGFSYSIQQRLVAVPARGRAGTDASRGAGDSSGASRSGRLVVADTRVQRTVDL